MHRPADECQKVSEIVAWTSCGKSGSGLFTLDFMFWRIGMMAPDDSISAGAKKTVSGSLRSGGLPGDMVSLDSEVTS